MENFFKIVCIETEGQPGTHDNQLNDVVVAQWPALTWAHSVFSTILNTL